MRLMALACALSGCLDYGALSILGPRDLAGAPDHDLAADLATDLAAADLASVPFCGGPSRCASASLLDCIDFESGVPDPLPWRLSTTNANAALNSAHVCRGSSALRSSTSTATPASPGLVSLGRVFSPARMTLHVRAFFYIAQPAPDTSRSLRLMALSDSNSGIFVSYEIQNGNLVLREAKTSILRSTTNSFALDAWNCLELEVTATGIAAWQDEQPVASAGLIQPGISLDNVELDMDAYANTTLWIDEIAVNMGFIGCKR